ncbi:MAG: serine/threonine protein kinase [Deltaproteobacteria bacterium]
MPENTAVLPRHIAALLKAHPASRSLRRRQKVFTDTTDFTAIDYGDVIHVDNRYFLVTGYTREGRFGVDEQPKQWVPRCLDLESGSQHILKLVFYETFTVTVGQFTIPCFRNPEKEAAILELIKGHPHFMQGHAAPDAVGNPVRILDVIFGRRLDKFLHRFEGNHREYFKEQLPALLAQFLECTRAIALIHARGMRHGDIRRDHLFVEYDTGLFRWIDFDYDFYLPERPFALDIFELGNLLMYIVGRGHYMPRDVLAHPAMGKRVLGAITAEDTYSTLLNR